jgi:alginate O-acetyltransferase complex protein AlgI
MLFSSPRFLVFLAVVLAVLGLLSSRTLKLRFLAAASCFFYAAWDWRFLSLLFAVSAIDYYCAWRIHDAHIVGRRRAWLALSLCSNLGLLGYFKYANFFLDNFNGLFGAWGSHIPAAHVLLPAGISFYTFKTMSYTIDVYRRELEPCHSWINYATFVTFFPELIAGPIVRGSVFLPQMTRDIGPARERMVSGLTLFGQGLIKKLLFADRLATIADPIFGNPALYAPATIWCGVLAYALQIYCDFSGYSDMAIGTARMIGYDLPENFRMPYTSSSITEFWRRWHITLSTWLRDYLYIPLGGNRRGHLRMHVNLMLTMLLGGLWHGASWNFVLWGGLHGFALAVHKLFVKWRGQRFQVPVWLGWMLTFLFVLLTWVPFRARSFAASLLMLRKMLFLGDLSGGLWSPTWLRWLAAAAVLGHLMGWLMEKAPQAPGMDKLLSRGLDWFGFRWSALGISGVYLTPARVTVAGSYVVCLVLLLLFYFVPMNTNPFIYFQF